MSYITTGTVTHGIGGNPTKQYIYASRVQGEGTIQIEIKPGTARKGGKYTNGAISDVIYVDNTSPKIILNGTSEITLEYGAPYIELGAEITDNLDPDIESKLIIDSSKVNVNQAGTYYVYYSATDHAGNVAEQVVRTVTVLEAPPAPEDRIEFTKVNGTVVSAKLVFRKTESPAYNQIQMHLAYKKDGVLQHFELLRIEPDLTTGFLIPEQYKDCDIDIYVWDRKMRPLMSVQRMNQ